LHTGSRTSQRVAGGTTQGADANSARVWALAAYEEFFPLSKDAASGILILKQAKAEYGKLQQLPERFTAPQQPRTVSNVETVTAAGTVEGLLKKLRHNIRETIEQNGELASPEAFVGCVVVRFETEDGEPTTIKFLVPRGCGGKIVEREIKNVP
jgi:hypothetical protein